MLTRVIDVGDGDTVCLVLTDKDNMSKGAHYVALSYYWGEVWRKLTEGEKDKWSTTTRTEESRKQGFLVGELPQTFQDVISVTRELSQRYLWIDSLCII
ncbi:hypothetical protein DL95DRAFT_307269 [Leptodontidium sp. 2 PMI_412]|nr:hypothetical protein DL95DRAFT_307269 [Leptodontidium sp. 2 PMI_412]